MWQRTASMHRLLNQRAWWLDAAFLLGLLAAAAAIGAPVLFGGALTYLDNPVHLAEIQALATEGGRGWSRMALAGMPLGGLHSPLGYGPLIALAQRGVESTLPYRLCLLLGAVAVPWSVYGIARRWVGPLSSLGLASLLLLQREAIVGIASVWGGMWTFYVAMAVLLWVGERWVRPEPTSIQRFVVLAGLIGVVGLLHAFATLALVFGFVVHATGAALLRRDGWVRRVLADGAAAVAGAGLSAAYWAPAVLTRDHLLFGLPESPPWASLGVLLLPVNLLEFFNGGGIFDDLQLGYTDALPIWALWALGLAGAGLAVRPGARTAPGPSARPLALWGASFASLLLVLLLVGVPTLPFAVLGPVPWRMTFPIRMGFALAAVPALVALEARWSGRASRRSAVVAGALAALVGSALWMGRPLAVRVPPHDGAEVAEVQALWQWMREARTDAWARVAVQGTFSNAPEDAALVRSHLLSLTHHETGVASVVGAYYGVAPYPTTTWTRSERGSLFGLSLAEPDAPTRVAGMMHATATSHLVLSDPAQFDRFRASGVFRPLVRIGRFGVLQVQGPPASWVVPLGPGAVGEVTALRAGEIALSVTSDAQGGRLVIRESYHPFWRVERADGEPAPPLSSDPTSGLMVLGPLDPGGYALRLRYGPPTWPARVSMLGWFVWLFVWLLFGVVRGLRSRSRSGPRAQR